MAKVLEVYGTDSNLSTQLNILSSTIPEDITDIVEVISYLLKLSPAEQQLIHEVVLLAKLILVMPATNSTSERSFSAMRRVKSYLCSTMLQERLNSLVTIHVHKDLADKVNITDVCNEFVCKKMNADYTFLEKFEHFCISISL